MFPIQYFDNTCQSQQGSLLLLYVPLCFTKEKEKGEYGIQILLSQIFRFASFGFLPCLVPHTKLPTFLAGPMFRQLWKLLLEIWFVFWEHFSNIWQLQHLSILDTSKYTVYLPIQKAHSKLV